MNSPRRILQNASTGRSFANAAFGDHSAPAARERAASLPQSFAKALQALDDSSRRRQQKTSKTSLARGIIIMPSGSSFHQMIQTINTFEVGRVAE